MNIPLIDLKETGKNIRHFRKVSGMSVEDVRKRMGFNNPQSIYKWEEGKSVPTVDNLVIIASLYGVTVDDLIAVV